MKKVIIILGLIGCSENKSNHIKEVEIDTLMAQDTMIGSFANQLKCISKNIETKNVSHKKSKDSLSKQLKSAHNKNKSLEHDADFYINALNGYSEIVNKKEVKDAYFNSVKDTTK
jgi:hypothetical protein